MVFFIKQLRPLLLLLFKMLDMLAVEGILATEATVAATFEDSGGGTAMDAATGAGPTDLEHTV
jgi:hypothetical protein